MIQPCYDLPTATTKTNNQKITQFWQLRFSLQHITDSSVYAIHAIFSLISSGNLSWHFLIVKTYNFTNMSRTDYLLQINTKAKIGRKEGNFLFNDALNTIYLRLYVVRHMVKHQKGNPLPPHGLFFPISSKGSFIYIQDNTYHGLCYSIAQWVHHEGSIRRPIAPWANVLTIGLTKKLACLITCHYRQ